MAASTLMLCCICDARHLTKYAEHWCHECAEGLCCECLEHHSLSKATREHELISIENYKKLPTFIASITDSCKEHGTKCSHYCQQHDQICCSVCITSEHKACVDLQILTDVIKNSKTSPLMTLLEEQLSQMLFFIDSALKDREENISDLKEDHRRIVEEIQQIRNKINFRLDTLEKTILKELTGNHKTNSGDIQARVAQLSEKSHEIKELRNSLIAVKEYGSDLQAFFGARKIDDDVNKAIEYLKSTTEEKYFYRIKMIGKINDKLADIFSLTSFGQIGVSISPSSVEYKAKEENAAQVLSVGNQMTPKSVYDIQLKLVSAIQLPKGERVSSFGGCTVNQGGEMICTDNGNLRLVVLNTDNMDKPNYKEICLASLHKVYDVTLIDQHTVAVSTDKGLKQIDIDTEKNIEDIKTDRTPYGVTYHKGSLMWCEEHHGIKKMDLNERAVSTILQRKSTRHSFLKAYDDKIYLSDHKGTVKCFSLDGRRQWKFKDTSLVNQAAYVTVDNNTFIYTSSNASDNVLVISPDGKQSRQLLSRKDGLWYPKGICFDRRRNKLFLVNLNGTVFIYRVD